MENVFLIIFLGDFGISRELDTEKALAQTITPKACRFFGFSEQGPLGCVSATSRGLVARAFLSKRCTSGHPCTCLVLACHSLRIRLKSCPQGGTVWPA